MFGKRAPIPIYLASCFRVRRSCRLAIEEFVSQRTSTEFFARQHIQTAQNMLLNCAGPLYKYALRKVLNVQAYMYINQTCAYVYTGLENTEKRQLIQKISMVESTDRCILYRVDNFRKYCKEIAVPEKGTDCRKSIAEQEERGEEGRHTHRAEDRQIAI